MKKRLLALLLLLLLLPGCGEGESEEVSTLEILFFDVGKADACLLRTAESAVLIDCATNKEGERLAAWLQENGVAKLDALFITHFDKDHVGGADKVLESVEVAAVYEPAYSADSKQLRQYREALSASGTKVRTLHKNAALSLDGVDYIIDVANEVWYGEDEENDFSLVISVRHGKNRFLFAGDAERPRLQELLEEGNLAHELLKVPHHGRGEKNSALFFAAVAPRYAVITSSAEEPEEGEVVTALEGLGAEIFLTREGMVRCISDGENIEITQ